MKRLERLAYDGSGMTMTALLATLDGFISHVYFGLWTLAFLGNHDTTLCLLCNY
jgi:hypothetical protein